MKAGYSKTYRKTLNSDVWKMPPLYHRVFQYLILKAKYKLSEFPTRKRFSVFLLPGQLITSMDTIAEDVGWCEWGVEKKPNKKTIKDVLTWLEGNSMVTVVSNAHGTFIEVVNWRFYHGGDEEKVTQSNQPEVTQEKRLLDTVKEVKEVKEKKEPKNNIVAEVIDHLNLICDKKYKASSDANKIIINARANEGFTVEDLKYVIEVKARQWKGDNNNDKYLRPETLFGKTKFESYLNESMPEEEVYATMAGEDGMLLKFYSKQDLEAYKIEKGLT